MTQLDVKVFYVTGIQMRKLTDKHLEYILKPVRGFL